MREEKGKLGLFFLEGSKGGGGETRGHRDGLRESG